MQHYRFAWAANHSYITISLSLLLTRQSGSKQVLRTSVGLFIASNQIRSREKEEAKVSISFKVLQTHWGFCNIWENSDEQMISIAIHQHSLGGQVKWELMLQAKSEGLIFVLIIKHMRKISFSSAWWIWKLSLKSFTTTNFKHKDYSES